MVLLAATSLAIQLGVHAPIQNAGIRFWFVYIFPPVRFIEFAIGVLIALETRAGVRSPVGLGSALALALSAYLAAGWVPLYAMWSTVTLMPFMLLIFTAASVDLERKTSWLRQRTLVQLGEWSYAFYLLHLLVIAEFSKLEHRLGWKQDWRWFVPELLAGVIAASILFYLVELPFERRLRQGHDLPITVGGTGHDIRD
jgi:peptidoglycan/LPS O-acetylase OafA/YrhL